MKQRPVESSSSDSEDDAQLREFMEAADTTLLTNEMFQMSNLESKPTELAEVAHVKKAQSEQSQCASKHPKGFGLSQRYLPEDEVNAGTDLNVPAAVQCHVAKKLTALIAQQIEFCTSPTEETLAKPKRTKSKIKLLQDAECYVKPYEEFEYDTKGPEKRLEIKRRKVDMEPELSVEEQLRAVVVAAEDIVGGKLLQGWAEKTIRHDKVFHYKASATGMLHETIPENEFTKLRRKNNWSEAKIEHRTKCKKKANAC